MIIYLIKKNNIPLIKKLPAAIKFAEANNINKIIWNKGFKNIGIVATGKAYADTMEMLFFFEYNRKKLKNWGYIF